MDRILTGASRGIGRALAVALARRAAPGDRLFLLARDSARLEALAAEVTPILSASTGAQARSDAIPIAVDLASLGDARAVGEQLAAAVRPGALLVHNAGLWPSRRELLGGVERAFALNCLAGVALQAPLLRAGTLSRVLVVSAGLLVKGRFDPARTPTGEDFSAFRTYCTTKLAGAIAMRDAARREADVEFAVVHPGVVATDLGARRGLLGAILRLVKRRWEAPDVCAERLARFIERPRWVETPGQARWVFEDRPGPWPPEVDRDERAVLDALPRLLAGAHSAR